MQGLFPSLVETSSKYKRKVLSHLLKCDGSISPYGEQQHLQWRVCYRSVVGGGGLVSRTIQYTLHGRLNYHTFCVYIINIIQSEWWSPMSIPVVWMMVTLSCSCLQADSHEIWRVGMSPPLLPFVREGTSLSRPSERVKALVSPYSSIIPII